MNVRNVQSSLAQGYMALENARNWTFWATPRISTYLYALCAGPYFKRETKGVVPYGLYCRKSFEKYLTEEFAQEWFSINDHAIRFYEDYMNIPYPYTKMDSVICPEYNFGAMENVGCITYAEVFI